MKKKVRIPVKHPGILEIEPGGFLSTGVKHFQSLVKEKGKKAIVRALVNLIVWHKKDSPGSKGGKIAIHARKMLDALKENLNEAVGKESSYWISPSGEFKWTEKNLDHEDSMKEWMGFGIDDALSKGWIRGLLGDDIVILQGTYSVSKLQDAVLIVSKKLGKVPPRVEIEYKDKFYQGSTSVFLDSGLKKLVSINPKGKMEFCNESGFFEFQVGSGSAYMQRQKRSRRITNMKHKWAAIKRWRENGQKILSAIRKAKHSAKGQLITKAVNRFLQRKTAAFAENYEDFKILHSLKESFESFDPSLKELFIDFPQSVVINPDNFDCFVEIMEECSSLLTESTDDEFSECMCGVHQAVGWRGDSMPILSAPVIEPSFEEGECSICKTAFYFPSAYPNPKLCRVHGGIISFRKDEVERKQFEPVYSQSPKVESMSEPEDYDEVDRMVENYKKIYLEASSPKFQPLVQNITLNDESSVIKGVPSISLEIFDSKAGEYHEYEYVAYPDASFATELHRKAVKMMGFAPSGVPSLNFIKKNAVVVRGSKRSGGGAEPGVVISRGKLKLDDKVKAKFKK